MASMRDAATAIIDGGEVKGPYGEWDRPSDHVEPP